MNKAQIGDIIFLTLFLIILIWILVKLFGKKQTSSNKKETKLSFDLMGYRWLLINVDVVAQSFALLGIILFPYESFSTSYIYRIATAFLILILSLLYFRIRITKVD